MPKYTLYLVSFRECKCRVDLRDDLQGRDGDPWFTQWQPRQIYMISLIVPEMHKLEKNRQIYKHPPQKGDGHHMWECRVHVLIKAQGQTQWLTVITKVCSWVKYTFIYERFSHIFTLVCTLKILHIMFVLYCESDVSSISDSVSSLKPLYFLFLGRHNGKKEFNQ